MFHIGNKSIAIFAATAVFSVTLGQPGLATTEAPEASLSTTAPVLAEGHQAMALALAVPDMANEATRLHYEMGGYKPVWFGPEGDDTNANALLDVLERAPEHALPAGRYAVPLLRQQVLATASGDKALIATAEIALTRAFLRYARDVRSGLLEPSAVDRELHVFPERPDEVLLLSRLSTSVSVEGLLASLPPQGADYASLKAELARLNQDAPAETFAPVADGPSIRLGEAGPRVAAMRARLAMLGDYQAAVPAPEGFDPQTYDIGLEDAVRRFQVRHGLNDDGIAGRRTIDAMNVTAAARRDQIMVNMERLRWMNRDLGFRHVYVNQADFTVQLMEGETVLFNERVVIGLARRHRTPEFSDQMSHMVLNPTWHVPRSIAGEEILPNLQADPEYLSKKNMRLVARGGGETPDPTLTDWSLYSANDFPYAVKQSPGAGNALGQVKFMFPNQFSIYLHDTPSKSLFRKDARAFSHGCVRVQNPLLFAHALLAPQSDDPVGYVQRILDRGREATVNLESPVPVHLTYRTAWIDRNGVHQFRDDVYGRDGRVLAALQALGVGAGADG